MQDVIVHLSCSHILIGTDDHSLKQAWLQKVATDEAAVKRWHHGNSRGFFTEVIMSDTARHDFD